MLFILFIYSSLCLGYFLDLQESVEGALCRLCNRPASEIPRHCCLVNCCPQKFYASFNNLTEIHNHITRNTKIFKYFIPRINKIFCKNLLPHRVLYYGVK